MKYILVLATTKTLEASSLSNSKILIKYGMTDAITIHKFQRNEINRTTNFLKR